MLRDVVLCLTIIAVIVTGDVLLKKYTEDKMQDIIISLDNLKEEIMKDEEDVKDLKLEGEKKKKVSAKLEEVNSKWEKMKEPMSSYIEHNELEKTDTEIVELNAYLEAGILDEVITNIEKTKYILEHIKDKGALELKNIF